jgi:hypothetical protein
VLTIKRTISAMSGEGVVAHNRRTYIAENVDPTRTHLNIEYCYTPIEEAYHQLFDEAQAEYNANQKRKDRRVENYYEQICKGKQEKPFYEVIFQVGSKDDMGATGEHAELAKTILDKFCRGFQERNPHLHVYSAHLHMDEATPHLHIDFIPFTTGSKRGLSTRVSLKQALADQGITGKGRSLTERNLWAQKEKEALAEIMLEHGIEWEKRGTHNKHLSVLDYKKQERAKEVAQLEETIAEKRDEYKAVMAQVQNFRKGAEELDALGQKLDNDPAYQLPEPTALLSAKSYRNKYALPLVNKLKSIIKVVLERCYEAWDNYHRLNVENGKLFRENEKLTQVNEYLREENKTLKAESRDYSALRKAFGRAKLDELVVQARATKQRSKRPEEHNRER